MSVYTNLFQFDYEANSYNISLIAVDTLFQMEIDQRHEGSEEAIWI